MPAVTLKCHERFITNTEVMEGQRLSIADSTFKEEMALGFHPDSGNDGFKVPLYGSKVPISSVLNHCFLTKASAGMAKEYLAFYKDAGCEADELDILGSKIELFASASDLDSLGADEKLVPKPKKKLIQMNEKELQVVAKDEGVKDWDKMGRKELMRAISQNRV